MKHKVLRGSMQIFSHHTRSKAPMKTSILTIMSIIVFSSPALSQPVNEGRFEILDDCQEQFLPPHDRPRKRMEDRKNHREAAGYGGMIGRSTQNPSSSFQTGVASFSGTASTESVTEAWVRQYASLGSDYSSSNALVRDSGGNVYVTGSSGGKMTTSPSRGL